MNFTFKKLKELAQKHSAELVIGGSRWSPEATLEFGDCRFVSTEFHQWDDTYGGFKFEGPLEAQDQHIALINDLNQEVETPDALTIERARELIGKVVECEYREYSKCKFRILRLEKVHSRQIGQDWHYTLVVNDCDALEYHKDGTVTWSEPGADEIDYPYEWQGVFRVTGSANPLRIISIED